jgi:hypothetical protein
MSIQKVFEGAFKRFTSVQCAKKLRLHCRYEVFHIVLTGCFYIQTATVGDSIQAVYSVTVQDIRLKSSLS